MFDAYQQLPEAEGEARASSTDEFLMRSLIGARDEAEFPSNEGGFDEDVNVYLVGLMGSFLSSAYHEAARRYLHPRDLDLNREVLRSDDNRHIYQLYKVNADHLLLAIGLFCHVEGAAQSTNPAFHREPDEFIGRGSIYYQLASSRLHRLRREETGASAALRKLGEQFERYVYVMRAVRTTYFHLTARISEGVLFHLTQAPTDVTPSELQSRYDAFLDAYSQWRKNGGDEQCEQLARAAQLVKDADPDFAFDLPQPGDTPT